MKKSNTASRLKEIMENRNLRQVDILNLTRPYCKEYNVKMNKSDISQYCSGKTEPNQDKLFMLGMALKVNEAWLMGYDVPMERNTYEDQKIMIFDAELDEALNILTSEGYSWNYTQSSLHDIIIKNRLGKIIECIPDNELVHRYEFAKNISTVTAKMLISTSFTLYPEEKDHINKYRELDAHGKEMVDFTLLKEWERSTAVNEKEPKIPIPMHNVEIRSINYYYRLASAGTGQIIFDTPPTKRIEIPNIPKYQKADYAIGVNGTSMEPIFYDGDTLLVEMTEEIEPGEIGIFLVDGECFVKKLGDGELISLNPEARNIPLTESSRCKGRVIDKL